MICYVFVNESTSSNVCKRITTTFDIQIICINSFFLKHILSLNLDAIRYLNTNFSYFDVI